MSVSLNIVNIESLVSCLTGSGQGEVTPNNNSNNIFNLIIDKRGKQFPYKLDLSNMRMTLISTDLSYISDYKKNIRIPLIFIRKKIKGCKMKECLHHEIYPFYKSIVVSCINEKEQIKLHVELNQVHILLSTIPVFDNVGNVIAITFVETPYQHVEEYSITR